MLQKFHVIKFLTFWKFVILQQIQLVHIPCLTDVTRLNFFEVARAAFLSWNVSSKFGGLRRFDALRVLSFLLHRATILMG